MTAGLLPFLAFAFVASVTPGPNNILVLATAASDGLRATVPLILGIALGFGVMVTAVGIGLAAPLASHAGLHALLRWVGAAWMLVLAWQIARSGGPGPASQPRKAAPFGFWGACAFQWVNPKAWVLALATVTTYTVPGEALVGRILLLAGIFVLVCLPSTGAWAVLGAGTGRLLSSPARLRAFNLAMGLLLAASVIPVLLG